MDENEKTKENPQEELIEVDVEETEDILEEEIKTSKKVDPEKEKLDKIREDFHSLIKKNKDDQVVDKYMNLFKEFVQSNKEKEDYLKTAQMVQANFENYKKRAHKDQEWYSFQNKMKIVEKFFSFYDDLERSVNNFSENPDVKSLREGLELVFNNLKSTFESLNIKTINPADEIFNPQFHDAIHVVESEEISPNTIVEVVSIGFILDDVVIKPAKVVISRKINKNANI
ncbi:MAG: nucleotide exchange factor GrpE [Candidatus Heimdallarchaeota archaeon]|nr:nucleotide exchange factor GrpE [Candidatus Heimdallarchaeota archaeon]